MRRVSKRRAIEGKLYAILREEYFENHPVCEAQLPGCYYDATDIHHKAGREGKLLNMVKHWMPVCRYCHRWITDNGAKAKTKGWKYEAETS
jgi:hypothetical protein